MEADIFGVEIAVADGVAVGIEAEEVEQGGGSDLEALGGIENFEVVERILGVRVLVENLERVFDMDLIGRFAFARDSVEAVDDEVIAVEVDLGGGNSRLWGKGHEEGLVGQNAGVFGRGNFDDVELLPLGSDGLPERHFGLSSGDGAHAVEFVSISHLVDRLDEGIDGGRPVGMCLVGDMGGDVADGIVTGDGELAKEIVFAEALVTDDRVLHDAFG